ncbi:MAG: hypothetical protein DI604_29735 [Delftia acidovorans]|nr:MAG: hypothetical protein DI604_29735 [Delftia acidovorans]
MEGQGLWAQAEGASTVVAAAAAAAVDCKKPRREVEGMVSLDSSQLKNGPHATLAAQGPLPPKGAAFHLGAARR